MEHIVEPLDRAAYAVDVEIESILTAYQEWRSAAGHLEKAAEGLLRFGLTVVDGDGRSAIGVATGIAVDEAANDFHDWVSHAAERADATQRVVDALQARQRSIRDLLRENRVAAAAQTAAFLLPIVSSTDPRARASLPLAVDRLRGQVQAKADELLQLVATKQLEATEVVDRASITDARGATKAYYAGGAFVFESLDDAGFHQLTIELGRVH